MRKVFLSFVILLVGLTSCVDTANTRKTLVAHGFSKIETGGYALLACGRDDFYATEFRAVNTAGQAVEGVVCCGILFKGCTVRF